MRSIPAEESDKVLTDPDIAGRPWLMVDWPTANMPAQAAPADDATSARWINALRHAVPKALIEQDESCLHTPAQALQARLLGLPHTETIPWAALRAHELGLDGTQPWGFVHPGHWLHGAERTLITDPAQLALDAAAAGQLMDAMQPYFAEDGLTLITDQPTRWLVCGEPLRGLRTASLARVLGRDVSLWTPEGDAARWLRRLQSEMQMLLYQHPLHDERKSQGLPPVNSFWLDGVGSLPAGFVPNRVDIRQAQPDQPGTLNTASNIPLNIALCGERAVAVLSLNGSDKPSPWQRLARAFSGKRRTRELQALVQGL